MKRALRLVLALVSVLAAGLVLLALFGPREEVDLARQFDTQSLGADIDAYLAREEAAHDGIVEGVEKQVIWAGAPGMKTPISIIYLHGFSATSQEIRPVPDRVAEALGANLFYTRLSGHGRGGAAMAEPGVADWVRDLDEALAIGRALGERVLVISTSTGGTLAALAAQDPARAEAVVGMVLISPNFRIRNKAAMLLTWPAAQLWLPWLVGAERSFVPANADHEKYWTTAYPTVALVPMAALVKAVRGLDVSRAKMPVLAIYSDADQVVDAAESARVLARWGGEVTVEQVPPQAGMDPANHVIAGDIMSPGRNEETISAIVNWAEGLSDG